VAATSDATASTAQASRAIRPSKRFLFDLGRKPVAAAMTDLVAAFLDGLFVKHNDHSNKWEFSSDKRQRSHTICVTLSPADAQVTIAHRAVGTDGCMSQLHAFSCDVEHLPKLIQALTRALALANKHGLIKQPHK
jgi:hypothetical protein